MRIGVVKVLTIVASYMIMNHRTLNHVCLQMFLKLKAYSTFGKVHIQVGREFQRK